MTPADASPASPPPDAPSGDGPPPSLSWGAFGVCLGITLAIFFFLHPFWEPLDMEAVDQNILWSYAPIPLLVLAALAFERKLGWAAFVLETLRLTLVKFAVTYLVANTVWAVHGPPPEPSAPEPRPAAPRAAEDSYRVRPAPEATPLDPARLGLVAGRVISSDPALDAGAWVFVSGGLDDLVFEPPLAPLERVNEGAGYWPDFAVLQTYQPLVLRNEDGQLHTAHAFDIDGRQLFNYPVLAEGQRELMFARAQGPVELACRVHGHSEPPLRLLVLAHPFAAPLDVNGVFRLEDVPAGDLRLSVWLPSGRTADLGAVTLAPGGEATLELTLE